jgi:hypothetical protein
MAPEERRHRSIAEFVGDTAVACIAPTVDWASPLSPWPVRDGGRFPGH